MSMRGTKSNSSESHDNGQGRYRRWRSSMVEQLICNQQVAGSSPIASSVDMKQCKDQASVHHRVHEIAVSDGFPSGQREQTVNLSPLASKVRILPRPPESISICEELTKNGIANESYAGVAQLVELQPSKLDVAGSRPVSRSEHMPPT